MSYIESEEQVTVKKYITQCDGPDCKEIEEASDRGWYSLRFRHESSHVNHFHNLACLAAWVNHRVMHYEGQAKANVN